MTGLQLLIPEVGLEMEWGVEKKNLVPEDRTEWYHFYRPKNKQS